MRMRRGFDRRYIRGGMFGPFEEREDRFDDGFPPLHYRMHRHFRRRRFW